MRYFYSIVGVLAWLLGLLVIVLAIGQQARLAELGAGALPGLEAHILLALRLLTGVLLILLGQVSLLGRRAA